MLWNDSGDGWAGSTSLVSGRTIENNQCRLDPAQSSVSGSGNTVSVNLALTFKLAFAGARDMYVGLTDRSGGYTGGIQYGTWTVPPPPPPPLMITTSSLPNAMTVGSGGLLFGTPSVAQVFHLVVHLSDSANGSVLGYLDLTVTRGGTLTVSGTTAPAPASAGQTVTFYANGSGGSPGYAYQWSGAVAGTGQSLGFTPSSSGIYTAYVTVTDSLSHTSGTSVSVNVGGGAGGSVTIITSSLPNGSVGVNYSAPLSASGGTRTYTWSVASRSSLPAWFGGTVALSASGAGRRERCFSPSSVTGSGSSVLTLATNMPNTPRGTSSITLTGASGSSSAQTTVTLMVTAPGATPSSTTVIPFGWFPRPRS